MLTLIGPLINGTNEVFLGQEQIHEGRMKGDDSEIDTAQTPKRLDERLPFLEKIRKTFTDSIPKKSGIIKGIIIFIIWLLSL